MIFENMKEEEKSGEKRKYDGHNGRDRKMKRNLGVLIFVVSFILIVLGMGIVEGAYSSSTSQQRSGYRVPYSASDRNTYWPILGDAESCQARTDLALQISPGGCQPAVVRSDLLAEQNVPVFCQIDALEINPLIDIKEVSNIRFTGDYPEEVIGTGFHPARAALRSRDRLLGSPLINNIGYVVVVLKQNEVEADLPESVTVNLTGQIEYNSGNALGIGRGEFILEPVSDEKWEELSHQEKNSFWQGRYSVRLESADPENAVVTIYQGDRKISTTRVERGKESRDVFVPGFYCQAGLTIRYDGLKSGGKIARLSLGDREGSDIVDVFEGSRLFNNQCIIQEITKKGEKADGLAGSANSKLDEIDSVKLRCGSETIVLTLGEKVLKIGDRVLVNVDGSEKSGSINGIDGDMYSVSIEGETVLREFNKKELILVGESGKELLSDKEWGSLSVGNENLDIDSSFNSAREVYEKVAEDYPSDRISSEELESYGEQSLSLAIDMSRKFGKLRTENSLIKKFLEIYPDSAQSEKYKYRLGAMARYDLSNSVGTVEIQGKIRTIELLEINVPDKVSKAEFSVPGVNRRISLEENEILEESVFSNANGEIVNLKVNEIKYADRVSVRASCKNGDNVVTKTRTVGINQQTEICDGSFITLEKIDLAKTASIQIIPQTSGTKTETSLSVTIGIEKRGIELSPEKTKEKLENLNQSIERWGEISDNLGNVVKGLKGACFATAGILTIKNFISGLDGTAIARQKVMRGEGGWTDKCAAMTGDGKTYPTLNACFLGEEENINRDVAEVRGILNEVNGRIEDVEKNYKTEGLLGFGENVDTGKAKIDYCNGLRKKYNGRSVASKEGSVTVEQILKCDENNILSYNDLRELDFNLALSENSRVSSELREKRAQSSLRDISTRASDIDTYNREKLSNEERAKLGLPAQTVVGNEGRRTLATEVTQVTSLNGINLKSRDGVSTEGMYVANVYSLGTSESEAGAGDGVERGDYVLLLDRDENGKEYRVAGVFKKNGNDYEQLNSVNESRFTDSQGIGLIVDAKSESYNNGYENPEVKYYESGPLKGMPAVVPIDTREGWYAATKPSLSGGLGGAVSGGSGIATFESNGRALSFYLANVGPNSREEYLSGDDIYQLINLNTGQDLGLFPGLSEQKANKLVRDARRALEEAADQYGNKIVRLNGQEFPAKVAPVLPNVQCQDFMSPRECNILFNVCDPVICPSSRCDLGGTYPVADVVQTGVVGSALLCLPNAREKIAIPVCLTGIQAGIDGFVSIMESHRDCLQENLETGRLTGVCDEIYSVYMCEFFWRQVAPVANILIPKLVESAYGQGTRGGGEYMTVMGAWQNMENSIDYFKQSYAVNSFKAFEARNIQEAGGEFCKSFVSVSAPSDFENLIEPDSPPQFHARFDEIPFSSATVPSTSQYKVFYHIFAGKDTGVHYAVYLKGGQESGLIGIPGSITVDTGFISRGEKETQTKDFTAPSGYKELCVRINNQEECGFGQVSTSFLVNQLSDSYVSEQINQNDIRTERECISGSASVKALLQGNIQEGLTDVVNPEIYNRGVVRICGTDNPGSGTDPTRFVVVGNCGTEKLKCWLDKTSVDNAITDSNLGLKNATLQTLQGLQNQQLERQGFVLQEDEGAGEIEFIRDKVGALILELNGKGAQGVVDNKEQISALEIRIDSSIQKLVLNHQKAALMLEKGKLREAVANALREQKAKVDINEPSDSSFVKPNEDSDEEKDLEGKGDNGEDGVQDAGESEAQEEVKEITFDDLGIREEDVQINEAKVSANVILVNGIKRGDVYIYAGSVWAEDVGINTFVRVGSVESQGGVERFSVNLNSLRRESEGQVGIISRLFGGGRIVVSDEVYDVLRIMAGEKKEEIVEILESEESVGSIDIGGGPWYLYSGSERLEIWISTNDEIYPLYYRSFGTNPAGKISDELNPVSINNGIIVISPNLKAAESTKSFIINLDNGDKLNSREVEFLQFLDGKNYSDLKKGNLNFEGIQVSLKTSL